MIGKMPQVSKKRFSVGVSEETELELMSYAKNEGVTVSWVIRKALVEFLERNVKQKELPMK